MAGSKTIKRKVKSGRPIPGTPKGILTKSKTPFKYGGSKNSKQKSV